MDLFESGRGSARDGFVVEGVGLVRGVERGGVVEQGAVERILLREVVIEVNGRKILVRCLGRNKAVETGISGDARFGRG